MSLKHYFFLIFFCKEQCDCPKLHSLARIFMLQKQMLFGLEIHNMGLTLGNAGGKTHIHPPKNDKTKQVNTQKKSPSKQNQKHHTNLSGDFEIAEKETKLDVVLMKCCVKGIEYCGS